MQLKSNYLFGSGKIRLLTYVILVFLFPGLNRVSAQYATPHLDGGKGGRSLGVIEGIVDVPMGATGNGVHVIVVDKTMKTLYGEMVSYGDLGKYKIGHLPVGKELLLLAYRDIMPNTIYVKEFQLQPGEKMRKIIDLVSPEEQELPLALARVMVGGVSDNASENLKTVLDGLIKSEHEKKKAYNSDAYLRNAFFDIASFGFEEESGGMLEMYGISGLGNDPAAYNRTFIGWGSLFEFSVRRDLYKIVLKELAFQSDFQGINLIDAYNGFETSESLNEAVDMVQNLQLTGELAIATAEFLSDRKLGLLKYVQGKNEYLKLLNKLKHTGRAVRNDGLKNYSKVLTGVAAMTQAIEVVEMGWVITNTALLLDALQYDLGVARLEELSRLSRIEDPAFLTALAEVLSELKNIPDDFWNELLNAIDMNRKEVNEGVVSLLELVNSSLSLSGFLSSPTAGWIGAGLFGIKTYIEIQNWNSDFKCATVAASIYADLLKNKSSNPGLYETELIEYSGLEFYKRIQECMNYTWLKAWELVRPAQKVNRKYIEGQYENLLSRLTYKRLQWFEESFVQIEVAPDAAITIGLILDSSGSMKESDPDGVRISASQRIIDELSGNENVFVVDFDGGARFINEGYISSIHKDEIKERIGQIDSEGGTSIGAGLNTMTESLREQSINPQSTAILLLTDGKGDYNNEILWYKYNGIPVHTVSYKNFADARLMSMLASETGGKYLQANTPEEIVRAFRQFYDDLSGFARIYSVIYETSETVETDEFYIEEGTDEVILELNGSGFDENFRLVTPGNQEVSIFELDAEIERGEGYIKLKLSNPQEGYWKAIISPSQSSFMKGFHTLPDENLTGGPNAEYSSGMAYGTDLAQEKARFIFEVRAKSKRRINLDIKKEKKGVYLLSFKDDNLVDYNRSEVEMVVTAEDGARSRTSQKISRGELPFVPTMGQGNYQLDIRLNGVDRTGKRFERQYFRSVVIDEYVPGYMGVVKRRIGKYIYSDQGITTRSKAGIKAIIYSQASGGTKVVAEGVVTAVTSTESTIEIKRRYGTPSQGDIVKLNIKQWKGD